jgi:hypothetical protein
VSQGLVGSPLHGVSKDGQTRAWCNTGVGATTRRGKCAEKGSYALRRSRSRSRGCYCNQHS